MIGFRVPFHAEMVANWEEGKRFDMLVHHFIWNRTEAERVNEHEVQACGSGGRLLGSGYDLIKLTHFSVSILMNKLLRKIKLMGYDERGKK